MCRMGAPTREMHMRVAPHVQPCAACADSRGSLRRQRRLAGVQPAHAVMHSPIAADTAMHSPIAGVRAAPRHAEHARRRRRGRTRTRRGGDRGRGARSVAQRPQRR